MSTIKNVSAKLIIHNEAEEEELIFAFREFGIFRLWQAENKPTHCIIENGFCQLGVLVSAFNRCKFPLVSISEFIDLLIEVGIIDEAN